MPDKQIVETTTQARAGVTPHVVRYMLFASLGLAVIAMIAVWLYY